MEGVGGDVNRGCATAGGSEVKLTTVEIVRMRSVVAQNTLYEVPSQRPVYLSLRNSEALAQVLKAAVLSQDKSVS